MVELIRTARSRPGRCGTQALNLVIVRAEPNALVVWTDADRDDAHTLELVQFRVDTVDHLLYRDTSPGATLASDGTLTFTGLSRVRLVGSWVANNYDDPANYLFKYVGMNGASLEMTVGTATAPRAS